MTDTDIRSYRLLPSLVLLVLGASCVAVAAGLLGGHAKLFTQKRDTAVMIGTQLPELKAKTDLLSASVEAERYFASQALSAREEQASAYVLPKGSPRGRGVSAMQEAISGIGTAGSLELTSLAVRNTVETGNVKTTNATLLLRGSFRSVASFLSVLGYGGTMMIRDVLSTDTQQTFLSLVQDASPLSLKAAEDFLYLDLAQYAAAADEEELRVLRDVPPDAADDIRSLLLRSGLATVRATLRPVARTLRDQKLWPLPLIETTSIKRNGDLWTVEVRMYSR